MKKDELLVPRLDFLIPMSFWGLWDTAHLDKASALGRVVEINPDWVIEVVNNEHRLEDVLHDFRGIYAEDEHFVPRIQADDVKVSMETYEDMKLSRDYYRQKYNELLNDRRPWEFEDDVD